MTMTMTDRSVLWSLVRWFREKHPYHSVHCPSARGATCGCWMSPAYDPTKMETTLPGEERSFIDIAPEERRRDRPDRRDPVPTTPPTEGQWPRVNLYVRFTMDGIVGTGLLDHIRQGIYTAFVAACEAEGVDWGVWWLDTPSPLHTILADLYALVDTNAPDTVIKETLIDRRAEIHSLLRESQRVRGNHAT